MPPAAPAHPVVRELADFAAGKLAGPDAERVALHLVACPACRELVANPPAPTRAAVSDTPGAELTVPQEAVRFDPDLLPPELRDHPRYQVVRILGQGGMGTVYQAQHRIMDRPVAVKVVNRTLVERPEAIERF